MRKGKVSLFSKFIEKRKQKSEIAKLKKLIKRSEVLAKKMMKNEMSGNEWQEFSRIEEDIKKMKQKYNLKDGKIFPIKKDQSEEVPAQQAPEQPVATPQQQVQQEQPMRQASQVHEQVQTQPQQGPTPQEIEYAQRMQAQRQAMQQKKAKEQHELHLRAEQERHRQEQIAAQLAQMNPEQREKAEFQLWFEGLSPEDQRRYIQQQQAKAQQVHAQQQAPPVQGTLPLDQLVDVAIFVQDMPAIAVRIKRTDMQEYIAVLDDAQAANKRINIDGFEVYGGKISGFKFMEAQ